MPHEEFHDPLAPPDPLRDWYVNTIWGKRVDDDDLLFEVMSLQVFQAGLTWRMILNKRDGFRSAFDNWSISTVAGFGPAEVESLRNDPGIIRNRLKIQATVENARTVLALQSEHGSFCNWFYEDVLGFDVAVTTPCWWAWAMAEETWIPSSTALPGERGVPGCISLLSTPGTYSMAT
mgnify:CR=1 FL=1